MSATKKAQKEENVTLIKKYANRRLYDTGRSSYVTLSDLCEMVQEGLDFKVVDAKSGDDITRAVLAQIMAEQESGAEENGLMPTDFMKNLIGFYGDNMKGLMPSYLQSSMDTFIKNQEQFRDQWMETFKNMPGMTDMQDNMKSVPNFFGGNMDEMSKTLENMTRSNMEMFEKSMNTAMKMFTPFGGTSEDKKK